LWVAHKTRRFGVGWQTKIVKAIEPTDSLQELEARVGAVDLDDALVDTRKVAAASGMTGPVGSAPQRECRLEGVVMRSMTCSRMSLGS
jgi:hypothetical protein